MTQDELKSILNYNETTGVFTRISNPTPRSHIGSIVGSNINGYVCTTINKKFYYMHRLAWLYVYGVMPKYIDHIDGNRCNNSISNLRSINKMENHKNMKKPCSNTSGVAGVYMHSVNKRWIANICIDGKTKYLGSFDDFDSAVIARKKAEKDNGFHSNHGR